MEKMKSDCSVSSVSELTRPIAFFSALCFVAWLNVVSYIRIVLRAVIYLRSDTFVMTRKSLAMSSLAMPTPISPIEMIPTVARGILMTVCGNVIQEMKVQNIQG
jgi:hypothetical protein